MLAAAAELACRFAFDLGDFASDFTMYCLEFACIAVCFRFAIRAIGSSVRIGFTRAKSGDLAYFFVDAGFRDEVFFYRADGDYARFFLIDFYFEFGDGKSG